MYADHLPLVAPRSQQARKSVLSLEKEIVTLKDTWTCSFVCLNKMYDNHTPENCKEKVKLSMAGLGEKKRLYLKRMVIGHTSMKNF